MAQLSTLGGSYESPRIPDWILFADYFFGVAGVDAMCGLYSLAKYGFGQGYDTSAFIQRSRSIFLLWYLVLGLLHERAMDAHH